MKKILFWLCITLPMIVCGQTVTHKLSADIRGVRCMGGSGLCSVLSETSKSSATAYLVKNDQSSMALYLDNATKSQSIQDSFIQEEDFLLDKGTLISLGIDPKWQLLKKGKYPVIKEREGWKILLSLSEL